MYKLILQCLLLVGPICLSNAVRAQQPGTVKIIEADKLPAEKLQRIEQLVSHEDWVLVKYEGLNYIGNFTNKDYILYLFMDCSIIPGKPCYRVEYSGEYEDKQMGGLDFVSNTKRLHDYTYFYLDGKQIDDPFTQDGNFSAFLQALKTAKMLKLEIYDELHEPGHRGEEVLELNCAISFKLAESPFLDLLKDCTGK